MPWLVDTGSELSQIDPTTAGALWGGLSPKGSAWVTAQSAFANTRVQLQLCRLKNCSFVTQLGPVGPTFRSPFMDLTVVMNPKLKNTTCILGLWTISRFSMILDYPRHSLFIRGVQYGFPMIRQPVGPAQDGALAAAAQRAMNPPLPPRGRIPVEGNPEGTGATKSRRLGRLNDFAVAKRRQLTLRRSWALQKMKSDPDHCPASSSGHPDTELSEKHEQKVTVVKREKYTPKQKASVRRARRRMARLERDDEELLRRVALASISVGPEGSEDDGGQEIVDLVGADAVSSGEDSVLGSSARPTCGMAGEAAAADPLFNPSEGSEGGSDMEGQVHEELPRARLVDLPKGYFDGVDGDVIQVPLATPSRNRTGSEDSSSGVSGGEATWAPYHHANPDSRTPNRSLPEGIYVTETGSPDVAALFDYPIAGPHETGEVTLHGAPARVQVYVTSDSVLLGASRLQAAIRAASTIGTYMPMAVGNHADVWLYDSGATISQASSTAIEHMRPYLTELDTGDVDFISVENQSKVPMRLYSCKATSLIQVESQVRSEPAETLIIENPMLKSFPLLLGLQTMSDLNLSTNHRMALVRDADGRPFRLYSKDALPKLLPSLSILSRKWQTEAQALEALGFGSQMQPAPEVEKKSGPPVSLAKGGKVMNATPPDQRVVPSQESEPGRKLSSSKGRVSPEPRSKVIRKGYWAPSKLTHAEREGNTPKFRWLVNHFPNEIQQYLLRSPEDLRRSLPKFAAFLEAEGKSNPEFKARWHSLWVQHKRWIHKPSRRLDRYSPLSPEVSTRLKSGPGSATGVGVAKEPRGTETGDVAPVLDPGKQAVEGKVPRHSSRAKWEWDPTPPHLATPFPKIGDRLPDAPAIPHPDLYASLQAKAVTRWGREFTLESQAGRTREVGKDPWYRKVILGDRGRGAGHAIFSIPSAKQLDQVLQSLLDLRQRNKYTSALLLIPTEYVVSDDIKTFLHAYCQKGEVYRYGKLFKRSREGPYLHLNQAVTEYWFDGARHELAALSRYQRMKLDKLLKEFRDCVGDSFDRHKQPASVPYVRLPVRADYLPHREPPFKKNPKMREVAIEFVKDLEKKGLISRCTNQEQVFVCNSLTIPKSDERYRFVCTFSGLNKNMLKDPYGMHTLDEVLTSLEGCSWFSTLDLVDGFLSLPLYPADRGYTAFHTPLGLFKWNVLPQGTSASPAIFQRMMDKWFAAFIWKTVIVWIDDILVYSKDFESHLSALREIFLVLRKYGLVASRRKLKVCMRSVRYLGYIFGVQGIRADPDKLSAVHQIPTPTTRKQVRQFLGFANFYRRFLPPNFSSVIAPHRS